MSSVDIFKQANTESSEDIEAAVINFRELASSGEHFSNSKDNVEEVARNLMDAFDKIGFAYLENTGLPKSLEENLRMLLSKFVDLEESEKLSCLRNNKTFHGYHLEKKFVNNAVLKREFYDIFSVDGILPPGMEELRETLFVTIGQLRIIMETVLLLLEQGLDLKKGSLLDKHQCWMKSKNMSNIRLMKYFAVPESVPEDTLRHTPHVDFGTFTLQFFVDVNGLKLQQRNGVWHSMKLNPNRILLFPGPVLESLTQGRFKAALHKVVIPEDPSQRRIARHTIILFTNIDEDCVLDEVPEETEYSDIPLKKVTGRNFFLNRATKAYRSFVMKNNSR